MILSIENGNFEVSDQNEILITTSFTMKLSNFFEKNNIRQIMCSSSVDFPEENGSHKTSDEVNALIAHALSW
tara:strand:- start:304 stop:519 length:216 start_codon:yes stop_codon:yes gene_type:complete